MFLLVKNDFKVVPVVFSDSSILASLSESFSSFWSEYNKLKNIRIEKGYLASISNNFTILNVLNNLQIGYSGQHGSVSNCFCKHIKFLKNFVKVPLIMPSKPRFEAFSTFYNAGTNTVGVKYEIEITKRKKMQFGKWKCFCLPKKR